MEVTPKSLRLHIALLGRVNAGKSSFLNLVTGQDVSITSEIAGTTTDVVEKAQELLPIGPVVWLDTAGLDDNTELGEQRRQKTKRTLDKADVAVLVCDGDKFGSPEQEIIKECETRSIPIIKVYNKADTTQTKADGLHVNSLDKSSRDQVLNELKAELLKIVPEDFIKAPALLGDLVPPQSTVILITPIDKEAPKGRLIMPQVQAIRDALDYDNIVLVVKENQYEQALKSLKNKPDLVVCDSQVVDFMVTKTPADIKCTTFSILFARLKGDLLKQAEGAKMIAKLGDGDKVLIAEACTHHAIEDDIGKVKIPNLLKKKTGKNLQIDFCAGCMFPNNLDEYKLVVQCGGCTQNRREILSRIQKCETAKVAITNYGICISELKGVLDRVMEPFKTEK
ncbi:MAG: [Alphaproteobacteria bacterium]|nr:[FeFe] hydrogenase H-cluster maturation GTPase HydF [Alphaproteobacteria bacterium]